MYNRNINEQEDKASKFHKERIEAFDKLETRFEDIKKAIKLGKIETIKYYRDNPKSFDVVIGTDMINDYFNDIETLLQ
jgi:phosphotransferase system IIB component